MADSSKKGAIPPQIVVVLEGKGVKRAYGRERLQGMGYAKAIQLFRADFTPEIAAVSPPLELQATFLGRGSSSQDAATLSDQGWAEMLGNVAQILIVVLQTPSSSGGSWASYGTQIVRDAAKKLG